MLINIPVDKIQGFDEIRSIDEATEILDSSLYRMPGYLFKISPEEEFKAHCSNIQAFFENGLNTDILHSNVAFPLLKALVKQGFQPAKKVFKEEIAIRFNEGTSNSRRFLYLEGYLNFLTEEEKLALEGYSEFIKSSIPPYIPPVIRNLPERLHILSDEEILIKVVVLGGNDVGRSLLIKNFSSNFSHNFGHKWGLFSIAIKRVELDNRVVKLQIFIPGDNPFLLRSSIIKGPASFKVYGYPLSLGVILMYDITNYDSLNKIPEWVKSIRENRGDIPILLVGNKIDLNENRVVSKEQANQIKEDNYLSSFIEISLKTGENVEDMFKKIISLIISNSRDPPYDYRNL
ncbi:MAG: Rab family GTPase [Promethearchaeota archaeon]